MYHVFSTTDSDITVVDHTGAVRSIEARRFITVHRLTVSMERARRRGLCEFTEVESGGLEQYDDAHEWPLPDTPLHSMWVRNIPIVAGATTPQPVVPYLIYSNGLLYSFTAGRWTPISAEAQSDMAELAKRIDEVGTAIYVGEAVPGTANSAPLWRIKRIIETENDIDVVWAGGDAAFAHIWDNRLSLNYS